MRKCGLQGLYTALVIGIQGNSQVIRSIDDIAEKGNLVYMT